MPHPPRRMLLLGGLNPDLDYRIEGSGEVYGGDCLMQAGLLLPEVQRDFVSGCYHLKAE